MKSFDEFVVDNELLESFLSEAYAVIEKVKELLASFAVDKDPNHFEKCGQCIDRVMGAAYTLGFEPLGELAKMGKEICYKSSQMTDIGKQLAIQSILLQLMNVLSKNLDRIKKKDYVPIPETLPLINKLKDVNQSLGNLRSSVSSS